VLYATVVLSWGSYSFMNKFIHFILEFVVFSALTLAFQLFTRKVCLQFSGLRMRNFTWNRLPIKNVLIDSLLTPIVESTHLNIDMCMFESSQKDKSRAQSADSSRAYRKPSAFNCYITSMMFCDIRKKWVLCAWALWCSLHYWNKRLNRLWNIHTYAWKDVRYYHSFLNKRKTETCWHALLLYEYHMQWWSLWCNV